MKHIDLFSGIGGFALALDNVYGKGTIEHTFCEIDQFCQEVLKRHWPNARIFGDIRSLTKDTFNNGLHITGIEEQERNIGDTRAGDGERVHILTGGFPCQPFSSAGKRRGKEDDRHLWPEMLRVIRETNPAWVVGENVRGLLTWNNGMVLNEVFTDLEGLNYEVGAFLIPAVAVNAPHRRDRVWIIAHSISDGAWSAHGHEVRNSEPGRKEQNERERRDVRGNTTDSDIPSGDWDKDWIEVATAFCRVDDGVPRRLDRSPRLKALGNAIVPQVAEEIFRAIKPLSP